ncbi:hypothetical protein MTR67_033970 [Solanum verrucosum]|uniref:Uncharacterized protein n=1 Tax=Solanum verrucosum TaxID=315347 RepID=A0AAF0U6X7_SOLVR|nr:hypothetical protein MTR67_033970 [Solanum verrucosum]
MTKERASYIMQLAKFDVVPQYIQINLPKRRKQQLLSQPAFRFGSTNLKIGIFTQRRDCSLTSSCLLGLQFQFYFLYEF